MTAPGLTQALADAQIGYELVAHEHTERARDEAAALGVAQQEVGKTLILASAGTFVRAVIPASERLDLHKVREYLGDSRFRLATEQELAETYRAFELGAVPPVGGPADDRVLVDTRIAELEQVIVEAGSHEESVRLRTADLLAATGADVTDICLDERARP